MISRVLSATGCSPAALELEITESVVMEDQEAAALTLQKLSEMGGICRSTISVPAIQV